MAKRSRKGSRMSVKKRGGRWHFDFMIRRLRYRGTLAEARTKQDAKDAEAAIRREVYEGVYGKPKGEGSFIEYAEQVFLPWSKANKRSWKTDAINVEVLKQYFEGKSFREITPMAIEKFKKLRLQEPTRGKGQRSVASVNRNLSCLSKIFSLAIRDGEANSNPCRQVKKYDEHNERNRYLLAEEEDRLFAALTGRRAHLRPIVEVAVNTGMRRGEILGMRWSWIDLARGYIHIPSSLSKSGKGRTVPMNQTVREVLLMLGGGRTSTELVFGSPKTDGPLTDIKHGFSAACVEAGLENFHFHDLRHTAATRLADVGADPFVIAEVLGHADLRMTKRYTHATDQRKREALEQIAQYGKKAGKVDSSQQNCHKIVTMETRKVG